MNRADPVAAPAVPRLSAATRPAYGTGAMANGVKSAAFSSYLMLYFNQVIGVPAGIVGTALACTLLVDAIVEIVETGNSLLENDLVELWPVLSAEAVLIGNETPRDTAERDRFLRRVEGVLAPRRYSLLEYNCPADKLEEATRITPGFSSPTVQTLVDSQWFAVRVLVERSEIHRILDQLEGIGCVAILESEVRHSRL